MFLWLFGQAAESQVRQTALGEIRHVSVPKAYNKALVLANAKDHCVILAWSDGRREIDRFVLDSQWQVRSSSRFVSPVPFTDIVINPAAQGISTSLFLLDRPLRSVFVVPALAGDTLVLSQTLVLPFEPTSIVAVDYNNDGRTDLLAANRDVPGIIPYLGAANGKFVERDVLAPDNPVGAFTVTDLNDDGLNDLVLFDWVSSDLRLFYGVGRGRLLEQSVFPVQGDIGAIVAGRVSPRLPVTFLLSVRNAPEIQVWTGNGFGDFSLAGTMVMAGRPLQLALADVNKDGMEDFVGLTDVGTLEILFYEYAAGFVSRVRIAAPPKVTSFAVCFGPDRKPDGIVFGPPGRKEVPVYRTGAIMLAGADSIDLVSGPSPVDVSLADLNRDGATDIIMACAGTQSLLISWGMQGGGWQGVTSIGVSFVPEAVDVYSTSDSSARFLVGSGEQQEVALVTMDPRDTTVSEAVIPTEGKPRFVDYRAARKGPAEFGVLNELPTNEHNALSMFEEVGVSKYLERSFRLPSPNVLLGACIADINRDGFPDIAYAYRSTDSAAVEVGLAWGDSALSMKSRALIGDIPDWLTNLVRVWPVQRSAVDTAGLLLWASGSSRQFWYLHGPSGSGWGTPVALSSTVPSKQFPKLRVADLDGDGIPDLVVMSPSFGGIAWFRGLANGFDTLRMIIANPSMVGFDLADVNRDGKTDVVTVSRAPDVIRIYDGAWIRRRLLHSGRAQ